MPTRCEHCNTNVQRGSALKGYEYEEGKFLVITKEELEALEPESSKTIEITPTVDAGEIDPIFLEASCFLEPEPAGRRGYKLLLAALEAEGKYAVAKVTMYGREQVIIVRPYNGVLSFSTMFYADEVRAVPECGLKGIEVKPAELKLARQLLAANAEKFDHASYQDGYRVAVEEMLESKRTAKPTPINKKAPKKAAAQDDILSVLQASIAVPKKRKSA